MFHHFIDQEERIAYGGSAFLELQYCQMKFGTSIKKIVAVRSISHWQTDSLYVYLDDLDDFYRKVEVFMDLKKVLEFLNGISKRPGMYVSEYQNYNSVVSFIDGYLFAYSQYGRISMYEMVKWYSAKIDKEINIALSAYFKSKCPNLTEVDMIQEYIGVLTEFIEWKILQIKETEVLK